MYTEDKILCGKIEPFLRVKNVYSEYLEFEKTARVKFKDFVRLDILPTPDGIDVFAVIKQQVPKTKY